jgi:hypothetical protein
MDIATADFLSIELLLGYLVANFSFRPLPLVEEVVNAVLIASETNEMLPARESRSMWPMTWPDHPLFIV